VTPVWRAFALFATAALSPLAIAAGPTVEGRLVAPPSAIAHCGIQLVPEATGFQRGRRELAGEPLFESETSATPQLNGHFEISAPHVGLWRVQLECAGWMPLELQLHALTTDTVLPTVELVPDLEAKVLIVNSSGKPIVGALVRASAERLIDPLQVASALGWHVPERRAISSVDGSATLPWARGERLRVETIPPGYSSPTVANGSRNQQLSVTSGDSVQKSIEVRDVSGAPVEGALLRVGEGGWPIGFTNASGRIQLKAAHNRSLVLTAITADGFHGRTVVPAGKMPEQIVLSLTAPDICMGRVVSQDSNRAIVGALVWADDDPGNSAETGDDGSFVLTSPLWTEELIHADASGFLKTTSLAKHGTKPIVQLHSAALLSGRVESTSGIPLAGVVVTAHGGTSLPPPSAVTHEDGTFTLTGLDPEVQYHVLAAAPGWVPAEVETEVGWRASPDPLVVSLVKAAELTGRLLEPNGRPALGARIVLGADASMAPLVRASHPAASTTTGDGGAFRLRGVAKGRYGLVATAVGYPPLQRRDIDITAPGESSLGDLVLEPGASQEFWLFDAFSHPVGDALVSARQLTTSVTPMCTTDRSGFCRLFPIPPHGLIDLLIKRSTLSVEVRDLLPSGKPLTLSLPSTQEVVGFVVDSQDRRLAGAHLSAEGTGSALLGDERLNTVVTVESQSNEDGAFILRGLPAGHLAVSVKSPGYLPLRQEFNQRAALPITLRLEDATTLSGRVVGPEGEPVVGARVTVLAESHGGWPVPSGITDTRGAYLIRGLSTGRVDVTASYGKLLPDHRKLHLRARLNWVDLQLRRGLRISGEVREADGTPLRGARVVLSSLDEHGSQLFTLSTPTGSFSLAPVVPGTYRLSATAEGFLAGGCDEPLEVAEDDVTDIEIALSTGTQLRGQLLGIGSEAAMGLQISALGPRGVRQIGRIDNARNYWVDGLGPGLWYVRAESRDGSHAEGEVRVGRDDLNLNLDLEFQAGHRLSGQVLSNGAPLADLRVALLSLDPSFTSATHTNEQGDFEIEEVPTGLYLIAASDTESGLVHSEEIRVESDRNWSVNLITTTVSGFALHAHDLSPAPGTIVRLMSEALLPLGFEAQTVAGVDGSFRFPHVAVGTYRIRGLSLTGESVDSEVIVSSTLTPPEVDLLLD
jgi:Carboxypeptidase regulatory-like domain